MAARRVNANARVTSWRARFDSIAASGCNRRCKAKKHVRYPRPVAKKKAPRPRSAVPRTRASGRKTASAQELKREKLYEARLTLAQLDVGGSPARPLDVTSASVVEARAESEPCLRCGLVTRCSEHATFQGPNGLLRRVKLTCRSCGGERELYIRIISSYLN